MERMTRGFLVVKVSDVDTEEVGVPNDRSRGDANASFRNVSEEVGTGRQGRAIGGFHGRGGHGVQHTHGPVEGGHTGEPVHRAVTLGDEHGEGVVGRQPGGT